LEPLPARVQVPKAMAAVAPPRSSPPQRPARAAWALHGAPGAAAIATGAVGWLARRRAGSARNPPRVGGGRGCRLVPAARRCAPPDGAAAPSAPAEASDVPRQLDDGVDGPACSLFLEEDAGVAEISTELLQEPWADCMDKAMTIEGLAVRACRKGAKQVATVGPASADEVMLERLFLAGVDVFRLNFSHGENDEKKELVRRIRDLEFKYKHPIGILADMQGPKQRCGKFADPDGVQLKAGQSFRFDMDPQPGDEHRAQLPHPEILVALTPGKTLLLDDGKIRMKVERCGYMKEGKEVFVDDANSARSDGSTSEYPPFIDCTVMVSGKLSARKGVNTPDVVLPISAITPKDKEDIKFACRSDVDWIALSFVQRHEDMEELAKLVKDSPGSDPKLLAKIEKPSAVDDLEAILQACDGVMVARGDLGVEMAPEEVPFVQKDIIVKAHAAGKPVIVATQMLESMMASPAPTRAECSDIANAIIDGCDAVMLSGESAVGKYPTESVGMQRRVVEAAERQGGRANGAPATTWREVTLPPSLRPPSISSSNAILASATTLAQGLNAKAIICFTATGQSVQRLVQLRPPCPVLAVCPCLETARWLSLLRGVYATSDRDTQELAAKVENEGPYKVRFSDAMEIACRIAREKGLATETDDKLVVMARLPLFKPGELNAIRIASTLGPRAADGYGPELESSDE